MSGFTTTGASVLTDIEKVPRGLLLWRGLTHWLGGMGIIVLSLAILPFLGIGSVQLYKAEVPSPVPDKLRSHVKDTALLLWKVYILFTAIETVPATGGFSTRNASVGHYQSAYLEGVIILFMLIAGINFSLHYQWLRGKPLALWRDPECRFFLFVVLLFVVLCTGSLHGAVYDTLSTAFRYAAFQVVSILTTTGFATADDETWPPLTQVILFLCMFLGGCAGSTGGGIKCLRILMLMKHGYRELLHLVHPHAVSQVKLGGRVVPAEVLYSVWGFFILYVGLFVAFSLVMAALGVDMVTAFSSVAATLGNIGPGFGVVGPAENYAGLPSSAKWLLSLRCFWGVWKSTR